jgi:hypothetical protein
MTYRRRKIRPEWMDGLTDEETAEVIEIGARCKVLDAELRDLSRRRGLIQRRAYQRVLNRKRRELA